MRRGCVYVAYGEAARREARLSVESFRRANPGVPVAVICGRPMALEGVRYLIFDRPGPGARWAKLNADRLAPPEWEAFVYVDADTRIHGDLSPGFAALEGGWDLALVPSENQGADLLWHVGEEERAATLRELGDPAPLQLQAGVVFVKRNGRTRRLFGAWRSEWMRWRGQDQAALLRALRLCPARVWLLGRMWNGGALVGHRFGMCRGKG